MLTVVVPPGALAAPADIEIQPIADTAPAGLGSAYHLAPPGQAFLAPVTLQFQAGTQSVDALSIAFRAGAAYWLRSPVTRDATTSTVSTTTSSFDWTDWSLVAVGPNTARDLAGTVSLTTTIDVPFSATGAVIMSYAGDGAGLSSSTNSSFYFLDGTLKATTPVLVGTTACIPVAPPGDTVPLSNTAVAEVLTNPPKLVWALNAYWNLACSDGSSPFISTQFDTLGIYLPGCNRGYLGTPIVGTDRVQCDGSIGCAYVIDCGTRGSTTATWSLSLCPGGTTCASSTPCHAATYTCTSGYPVCVDAGLQPDGTDCSTVSTPNQVCAAGSCVSCLPGSPCTPANACVEWAISSCATGPVCSPTTSLIPDGNPCGASSTCSAGACVSSRTVTGSRLVTYWLEDGATSTAPAPDVSPLPGNAGAVVTALVQAGTTWVQYPGTFTPDGRFSIPAVPVGPYQLVLVTGSGEVFSVATSADSVDVGFDVLGRPDQTIAATPTPVTLDLTNLSPWAATDEVQVVSVGAGIRDVSIAGTALLEGSTGGSVVRDWAAAPPLGLLGPTDVLRAVQMSHATAAFAGGSLDYQVAGRTGGATGITLASGAASTVPVALVDPPTSGALTVDWGVSGFEALLPSMGPAGIAATDHTLQVDASFGQSGSPSASGGAPVLLHAAVPSGSADVLLATPLAYGQSLPIGATPDSWVEWREARFDAQVPVVAPGASVAWNGQVTAGQRVPMANADGVRASPRLTPIGSPTWNGTLDATSSQGSVTTSPTLAWTPPPEGATSYAVRIWQVSASADVPSITVSTLLGHWSTVEPSIRIPPGILLPGSTYVAQVEARVELGPAVTSAPWRSRTVTDWAGRMTATFSP